MSEPPRNDKGKRRDRHDSTHRRSHSVVSAGSSYASTSPRGSVGPSHSRSQSLAESTRSSTRRREKAAVGFACLNCKRAHLACDVTRPCKRCVAMGRSSTCSDVPHKRRGRPRLREQEADIPESIHSPTQHQHSHHQHRRQHSRAGSSSAPYTIAPSPWSTRQAPPTIVPRPRPQPLPLAPRVQLPTRDNRTQATLILSTDLTIIRAPQDAQSFFCAPPNAIEGRTIFELCQSDTDRAQLPGLIRALLEEIRQRRLLLNVHLHRTSLYTDLLPYTNEDLLYAFPGVKEYPLMINFIDAMNRVVPSRASASIGVRSNDRFAYILFSVQKLDSSRRVERRTRPGAISLPPIRDEKSQRSPTQVQQSPTQARFGASPTQAQFNPAQAVQISPTKSSHRISSHENQSIAPIPETSSAQTSPVQAQFPVQKQTSPTTGTFPRKEDDEGGGGGKRTSMSLSEMIG